MASEGIVCEMAVAVSRRLVNDPHDLALSGRVLESGQPSIPAPPVADDAAAAAANDASANDASANDADAYALLSGGSAMRGKKEATETGKKSGVRKSENGEIPEGFAVFRKRGGRGREEGGR